MVGEESAQMTDDRSLPDAAASMHLIGQGMPGIYDLNARFHGFADETGNEFYRSGVFAAPASRVHTNQAEMRLIRQRCAFAVRMLPDLMGFLFH